MPANDGPASEVGAERMWTVTELADALAISTKHLHQLIHRGEIDAHRYGGGFRIPDSARREFLDRTKHAPAGGDQPGRVQQERTAQ